MHALAKSFLSLSAATLLAGFAPPPAQVGTDGHLPSSTQVAYKFACPFGTIDLGYAQQLAPDASQDNFRKLRLLTFTVSDRTISPANLGQVGDLIRTYEWIDAVSAQCNASGEAVLHVRGMLKTDWRSHIEALEAHDLASAGPRPERPSAVGADIRVAPSGGVAIRA